MLCTFISFRPGPNFLSSICWHYKKGIIVLRGNCTALSNLQTPVKLLYTTFHYGIPLIHKVVPLSLCIYFFGLSHYIFSSYNYHSNNAMYINTSCLACLKFHPQKCNVTSLHSHQRLHVHLMSIVHGKVKYAKPLSHLGNRKAIYDMRQLYLLWTFSSDEHVLVKKQNG